MVASIERFKKDVSASGRVVARIEEIAAATGIKAKTLRNQYYGATQCMRYQHVVALDQFYDREGQAA